MTIYEALYWTYRLPSLRALWRYGLYQAERECIWALWWIKMLPHHERMPGLFGNN